MKKVIIMIAALGLTFHGIAQEKFTVSAKEALNKGNLDEAKENIDKAQAGPDTKDKPKTLFVKARVYMGMQQSGKYNTLYPYKEATQSLFKLLEVKPDYEKSDVDMLLLYGAINYYNDGSTAYNNKDMNNAIDLMKTVVKIHEIDGGKRWDKLPSASAKLFDTAYARANQTIALSVYYSSKYDEAIPLLIVVKNNPITKTSSVYECLIQAYNMQKNTAEAFKVIEEARILFPDDANIRNSELNYYITTGKIDDLIKKLEETISKEPNNEVLLFDLATAYQEMATPKTGPKPSNSAELVLKAEDAYLRALKVKPDDALVNYNFGSLYFNQAADYNDKMNAITGTSTADQTNYDALKGKRDALFGKSMPYFEKAYTVYSGREKDLSGDEKNTYKSTVLALKEVYARQSKMDKSKEMLEKLKTLN